jgi:hypothetical protein
MEKLLACLVGFWLVCGATTAFLTIDQRQLRLSHIASGPFGLAEVLR